MICPNCFNRVGVHDTVTATSEPAVYRHYKCAKCGLSFYTAERIDMNSRYRLAQLREQRKLQKGVSRNARDRKAE